jgi:DNA-directed RNA polymerase specialized sigma24 family protein
VRVRSGEPELVRAGAAGDPAALAALWDAYGARVFAFCQRLLGRADAAADAAQDAFLLAHAELGSLARTGASFGAAVFQAARTTSYDPLARDRDAGGARPKRRPGTGPPAPQAPAPEPVSPAPVPAAPAPVTADAPADESPATSSSAPGAAPATAAQVRAAATPPTTTSAPQAPEPSVPAAQPATSERDRWSRPARDQDHGGRSAGDQDHGAGWHEDRRPCPPAPRRLGRSCRH